MTHPLALLLILSACGDLEPVKAYYPESGGPSLDSVEPASETGTAGGQTVTLHGSGFGDDPDQVTVIFGTRNATVLSISDDEIVVEAPRASIEAGPVDVIVSSVAGRATSTDGYTYDDSGAYDGQTARITVISDNFGTGASADYTFYGSAEFLKFSWPRFHRPGIGYNGTVETAPGWTVYAGGESPYISGTTDLLKDVGDEFTLTNPAMEGYQYCPTLRGAPDLQVDGEDCKSVATAADVVRFCTPPTYEPTDPSYDVQWSEDADFFATPATDGSAAPNTEPLSVTLNAPDAGLDKLKLLVPPRATFTGGARDITTCLDSDGDGSSTLDDDAMVFAWTPTMSGDDLLDAIRANGETRVTNVRVTVHASVQFGYAGWYGLESFPVRAVGGADDADGELAMPLGVLYQLPSITDDYLGFVLYSNTRLTEYTVTLPEGGTAIFAFASTDTGYWDTWTNPLDNDDCGDCIDNDEDGWADSADPDCRGAGAEETGFSRTDTCNDGEDNDDDGDIDANDADCTSATAEESNCYDGVDNDEDGFTDEQDGECDSREGDLNEDGNGDDPTWTCDNDTDDDEDGWTDFEDPDCSNETDPELGYGTDPCNDGLDNDGDGLIDAEDPRCAIEGATGDERPSFSDACDDGIDNDGDGYTDSHDPGCEYDPDGASEGDTFASATDYPNVPPCYDSLDNDRDGNVDVDDAQCELDGEPDGFQVEKF